MQCRRALGGGCVAGTQRRQGPLFAATHQVPNSSHVELLSERNGEVISSYMGGERSKLPSLDG